LAIPQQIPNVLAYGPAPLAFSHALVPNLTSLIFTLPFPLPVSSLDIRAYCAFSNSPPMDVSWKNCLLLFSLTWLQFRLTLVLEMVPSEWLMYSLPWFRSLSFHPQIVFASYPKPTLKRFGQPNPPLARSPLFVCFALTSVSLFLRIFLLSQPSPPYVDERCHGS